MLLTAAILTPPLYWMFRNALPFYVCTWAVPLMIGPVRRKYPAMHFLSHSLAVYCLGGIPAGQHVPREELGLRPGLAHPPWGRSNISARTSKGYGLLLPDREPNEAGTAIFRP